jgi:hypothetical protein
VQRIVDAMDIPAFVLNGRSDILATNRLGAALYSELLADPARLANVARFTFLNPRAVEFFADWDTIANDSVAILRARAGEDPYDRRLPDLVGEEEEGVAEEAHAQQRHEGADLVEAQAEPQGRGVAEQRMLEIGRERRLHAAFFVIGSSSLDHRCRPKAKRPRCCHGPPR